MSQPAAAAQNLTDRRAIKDLHIFLGKQLLRQNGKHLRVVAHLIALPAMLCTPGQPCIGVIPLPAFPDGKLQQLLGKAEAQLVAFSVTQGQIDRHKPQRGKAAQSKHSFQQQYPFSGSCRRQRRRNPRNAAARHNDVIVRITHRKRALRLLNVFRVHIFPPQANLTGYFLL